MSLPLQRLFIANRGEIARRIALTAKRLGIETVVLTDRQTPPAYLADIVTRFVVVAEESPALYLNAEAMLEHARVAGCDSVHPGFGFLSENAEFAAKTLAAGLIWVGPKPEAITAMASKASARDYAERAHVPCVRGLSGFPVPADEHGDFSQLEAFAAKAGYPLLMKAAYGGGGKGMRVVQGREGLRAAALRATSEAKNSFGNGALICEQYLGSPRHVEVQILADKHGQVFAIGDRDCSLQRRHQKIIEEAPATQLAASTRQALHQAAVNLAAAVGYDSTGTVEFLVDWSSASQAGVQPFYFLEMNTRLQVEHPVTEEVYGLDLVEWQLRVARGERLKAEFAHLPARGHSVEVRIYAEDVHKDFFPAPGPVAAFKPALGPGIRWELGLDEIDEVTGRFDPMIAKLVVTGADRACALQRMADALRRTVFAGPENNIEMLVALVTESPFAAGAVTTHFLGEHLPQLLASIKARREVEVEAATMLLDQLEQGQLGGEVKTAAATPLALTAAIFSAGAQRPAALNTDFGVHLASSSEHLLAGRGGFGDEGRVKMGAGMLATHALMKPFWYAALSRSSERQLWVAVAGSVYGRRVVAAARRLDRDQAGGNTAEVVAPVPGRVIAVKVGEQETVEAGQTLFILESMKMEFEVKAAAAGTIAQLSVRQNDQVTAGQHLAKWER